MNCHMKISKSGFDFTSDNLNLLRGEFVPKQCLVIPNFVSYSLAQQAAQEIDCSEFSLSATYRPNGRVLDTEMTISGSDVWVHALNLLLNDQRLFDAIEHITGCGKISCF